MSTIALANAAGAKSVQLPKRNVSNRIIKMSELIDEMLNNVELRPPRYQRKYQWEKGQFVEYITDLWNNGMFGAISLYKRSDTSFECIDGQHRLTAIKYFVKSIEIPELPADCNMAYIDARDCDNKPVAIFYTSTLSVDAWIEKTKRTVLYLDRMPGHEQNFKDIEMCINIEENSDIKKRQRIFTTMQQGAKVTGSDYFRNINNELVSEINIRVWDLYNRDILPRLATKPEKFGIHMLIRFYHLSKNAMMNPLTSIDEDAVNLFRISDDDKIDDLSDSALTTCLNAIGKRSCKTPSARQTRIFVYDKDVFDRFMRDVMRLSEFCKRLLPKTKLPPITTHAIYTHFSKMGENAYNQNMQNLVNWMKPMPMQSPDAPKDILTSINDDIHKYYPALDIAMLWERKIKYKFENVCVEPAKIVDTEPVKTAKCAVYRISYNRLLKCIKEICPDPEERNFKASDEQITPIVAQTVWEIVYETQTKPKCYVCDIATLDYIKRGLTYHNGHIIPRKYGGGAGINNTIPICVSCNRDMKSTNLHKYHEQKYPDVYKKNKPKYDQKMQKYKIQNNL
jgi:hypothetical protein